MRHCPRKGWPLGNGVRATPCACVRPEVPRSRGKRREKRMRVRQDMFVPPRQKFWWDLTNGRDFPVPSYPLVRRSATSATMGSSKSHQLTRKGEVMAILNVGIDLAKNVFALHGVNELGQVDLRRPSVPRTKLHALVAALPP